MPEHKHYVNGESVTHNHGYGDDQHGAAHAIRDGYDKHRRLRDHDDADGHGNHFDHKYERPADVNNRLRDVNDYDVLVDYAVSGSVYPFGYSIAERAAFDAGWRAAQEANGNVPEEGSRVHGGGGRRAPRRDGPGFSAPGYGASLDWFPEA